MTDMKNPVVLVKKIMIFIFPLICLASLYFLKTVPRNRLWKSYMVMAVEKNCDDGFVISTLQNEGCTNVISLSAQSIPLAPEIAQNIFLFWGNDKYIAEREKYFFDKSGDYKLYYVPSKYEAHVRKASFAISLAGYSTTVDSQQRFPCLSPILCTLAAVISIILAKRKFVFFMAIFFPVCFSWSMPFYASACAVCLSMPTIFASCYITDRKNGKNAILKSPFSIPMIFSFVMAFSVSLTAGILFLMCTMASICVFILSNRKNKRQFASRTRIIPASLILQINKKTKHVFYVCALDISVLLICFFLGGHFLPTNVTGNISMPSAYAKSESLLPGLDKYAAWIWNMETFPYKNLSAVQKSEDPYDGEVVLFPRYAENGTMITANEEILFRYDKAYRERAVGTIDNIPFAAVEKLLKAEGVYSNIGYSNGVQSSVGFTAAAFIIAAFFISFIAILLYKSYARKAYIFVGGFETR